MYPAIANDWEGRLWASTVKWTEGAEAWAFRICRKKRIMIRFMTRMIGIPYLWISGSSVYCSELAYLHNLLPYSWNCGRLFSWNKSNNDKDIKWLKNWYKCRWVSRTFVWRIISISLLTYLVDQTLLLVKLLMKEFVRVRPNLLTIIILKSIYFIHKWSINTQIKNSKIK